MDDLGDRASHPPSLGPGAEGPRIKGAGMREFLLWYESRVGQAAVQAIADGIPADLAPLVSRRLPAFGMLASTWYPIALCHYFLDRAMEGRGDEGRELARDANREIVPRMIRGIYKVIYRTVASPELYARHVNRQWRKLHTTGERSFVIRAPGEALSTVAGWPGHHPFLCWITIYTMVSLFEAMGREQVTAERLRCVSHGGEDCATVLRWR
jgi:hypothetical protein